MGGKVMDARFKLKSEAARYCREVLGHTEHYATGSCGDAGRGSREYYCAATAPRNEWGMPTDNHSTISRVCGVWRVSDFTW